MTAPVRTAKVITFPTPPNQLDTTEPLKQLDTMKPPVKTAKLGFIQYKFMISLIHFVKFYLMIPVTIWYNFELYNYYKGHFENLFLHNLDIHSNWEMATQF